MRDACIHESKVLSALPKGGTGKESEVTRYRPNIPNTLFRLERIPMGMRYPGPCYSSIETPANLLTFRPLHAVGEGCLRKQITAVFLLLYIYSPFPTKARHDLRAIVLADR